jgi:hypothetical protein
MVFLTACLRGLRERPGSGVRSALIAAFVGLVVSRLWLRMDLAGAGFVVALAAAIGLIVPAGIHEASGRWQLRPRCWEQGDGWMIGITARWQESFTGTCTVSDGSGFSAFQEVSQRGGAPTVLRFPDQFEHTEGVDLGPVQPRGRYLVRWKVRQAGNDFEANVVFVWR